MSSFPLFAKNYTATLLNWAPKLTELFKSFLDLVSPLSWGTWTPTATADSPMTYTVTSISCWYFRLFKTVFFTVYTSGTTATGASARFQIPLPIASISLSEVQEAAVAQVVDGGATIGGVAYILDGILYVTRYDAANFGLGTDRIVRACGFYRIN